MTATTPTATPSSGAATRRLAVRTLLLHHALLTGHAASGFPLVPPNNNGGSRSRSRSRGPVPTRRWAQPTSMVHAAHPPAAANRNNHRRRRTRYGASTPAGHRCPHATELRAVDVASVDDDVGDSAGSCSSSSGSSSSSSGGVEGVSVEPNLLTGAEIDLPGFSIGMDIDADANTSSNNSNGMSIRGGGQAAAAQETTKSSSTTSPSASKRQMLAFALPALGIFLVNPLLSNIDNAFVGRTVGPAGLAALSPATLCTDQVLYLFSFLARATTGLVARAYATADGEGSNGEEGNGREGNAAAARAAASAPLTTSLLVGLVLSGLYAVFTPTLLSRMRVDPTLLPQAASYVRWRGAIAWAALAQACCLQILLATRDALTPLKIVAAAAVLNVAGDYAFCVRPLRWGCAGAAAATSVATLLSSALMVRALRRKELLPTIRVPTRAEVGSLVEFMGPLMMITITRLLGFVYMQRAASRLGDVQSLAAFQICTNVVSFFLLFGEPLSQLSQTQLPALVDREDGEGLVANLRSVLTLGLGASLLVGGMAFGVARYLPGIFTADPAVRALAQAAAPSVFFMVANAILAVTVDGAMLASKDFGWMLFLGVSTFAAQVGVLSRATNLNAIFATFIFRLGVYGPACAIRAAMGRGAIGRAIAKTWREKRAALKGQ